LRQAAPAGRKLREASVTPEIQRFEERLMGIAEAVIREIFRSRSANKDVLATLKKLRKNIDMRIKFMEKS
jgi:hypothetical protein